MRPRFRTGFRKIAERPDGEIVFGSFAMMPTSASARVWTAAAFAHLDEPGFAKTALNFRIEPVGPERVVLQTETRVYATDTANRRAFTVYWRTIYPGSAIIRAMWLRAITARAERSTPNERR